MTDRMQHEMRAQEPAARLDSNDFSELQDGRREVHFPTGNFSNSTKPVKSVLIDGIELGAGDRVCIRPLRQIDPIDLILAGKTAVIEALEQDVDGGIHLGLVLDGDSEGYLNAARESGYLFFYPAAEVEPCKQEVVS